MSARRITPQPAMRPCVGTADQWELVEAYTVYDRDRRVVLTIPAGTVWDRASAPHALRAVADNDDFGEVAGLAHDYVYGRAGQLPVPPAEPEHDWFPFTPRPLTYTRAQADRLFLSLALADGVPAWKAYAAYAAVRLFGGAHWRTDGARVQALLTLPDRAPVEGADA